VTDAIEAQRIDAARPWPGLESYSETARTWFHGREQEAIDLLALIQRESLVVLYGRSGLGKTSLLQAGLSPLLRENGYLPVRIRLALDEGAPELTRQIAEAVLKEAAANAVETLPWPDGLGLWEYFHQVDCDFWSPDNQLLTPVLIFDQFEEIFTISRERVERRTRCESILASLGDVVENRQPHAVREYLEVNPGSAGRFDSRKTGPRVVLSFREDYLPDFDIIYNYLRARTSNRYRLLPMNGATAKSAIQSAGQAIVGASVAETIVRFIDSRSRSLEDLTIEPALLSLICRELNQTRISRNEPVISASLLQGDNALHIIEEFYMKGFEGLDPRVQHFVEDRLLTEAGFRDTCALDNALATPGVDSIQLARLVERRILRREERGGQFRLELIHDVLANVAKAHRNSRREREALRLVREQLAKQRRRQIYLGAAAGALLLVLFGVAWLAVETRHALKTAVAARREASTQASVAKSAEAEARGQSIVALSRLLAFESQHMLDSNPSTEFTLATLLAIEARQLGADIYAKGAIETARIGTTYSATVLSAGDVRKIALSVDGKLMAGVGENGALQWWDVARHSLAGKAPENKHGDEPPIVFSLAFSPSGHILAVGLNDSVQLWDTASQRSAGQIPLGGGGNSVGSMAFSPDGRQLAVGAYSQVRLFDVTSRRQIGNSMLGHDGAVRSIAFSPDSRIIATAASDPSVRLWDIASSRQIGDIPLGNLGTKVFSLAFSPDGHRLAGGGIRQVHIWDAASRELVGHALLGHDGNVVSLAFSSDGLTLATGSDDHTIRLWDVEGQYPIGEPLRGHNGPVTAVAFGADRRTLVSAADGGSVRSWNLESGRPIGIRIEYRDHPIIAIAFSSDGHTLASVGLENVVHLWDVASHRLIGDPLRGHQGLVNAIAFSPDGHVLASASADTTVRLWDVARHLPIGEPLRGHGSLVWSIAFSPDGHVLASGSSDNTIRLWDTATHAAIGQPLGGHMKTVTSLAFSPDGRTLASASDDRTIRLWNVTTREPIGEPIRGHQREVTSVAFSPDGHILASASADTTVRFWDVNTHRMLGEPLRGHDHSVTSVAFSPDGLVLASASEDQTVRLWDVESRRSIGEPLNEHSAQVMSVAFSPDGRSLASASFDNTVRIWDVDFGTWIKDLCERLPRNLTQEEWKDYIGEFMPYHRTCANLPLPVGK
jgi:WD40 repeat protein